MDKGEVLEAEQECAGARYVAPLPAYESLCTQSGGGEPFVLTIRYASMADMHAASAFIVQNSEVRP